MAYSTVEDLCDYMPRSVILQLTDDQGTNQIDTAKLMSCIARADDLIDSYLRGRYPVPIVGTVPAMINDLSCRLTAYWLYKRSLMVTLPEAIKDDFKVCTQTLVGMQQGKINAFDTSSEPIFFATNKTAADPLFTNNPVNPAVTPSMTSVTQTGQMSWQQYPI